MVLLFTFLTTCQSRVILADIKEPSVPQNFVILDSRPLLSLCLSRVSDGPICLLQCLHMEVWLYLGKSLTILIFNPPC